MANANIFSSYLQPVRSVSDYMADMDNREANQIALEGKRRQNALAELTMQQQIDANRMAQAKQSAIQQIYNQLGNNADPLARARALQANPLTAQEGVAAEKALIDSANVQAQTAERQATTKKTTQETAENARKAAIQQVAALNSPQEALALLKSKADAGEVPQQVVPALASLISTDPKWQIKLMLGIGDPKSMIEVLKPHIQTNNLGGETVTQAIDPLTGAATVTNRLKNSQSPDNAATVGATIRGQNLVDARARETNQLTKEANATVYDPERGILINKATGLARPAATMDGKPVAPKTPESTKKELSSIDAQMSVLDGAIRDVKASPDAFTFKRGLATMAGPLTESAVGRFDSPSERDARSYVFNVVSKVINERAGAAQSAQELARLRSFLPAETDNAQQITDKLESFKGYLADLGNGYQPGKYQPQQPKSATKINNDAEYNALPSGATFIGPDGKTRRKP